MKAPIRWKERAGDAAPELRAVMQYAATRAPSDAQVAMLTAAVKTQLAASAPAVVASSWLTGVSGAALATLTVIAAVSGSWVAIHHDERPVAPIASSKGAEPVPAAPVPAPVTATEPVSQASEQPTTATAHPRKVAAPKRVNRERGEVQLLQAARAAQGTRALRLLDEHEQRFSNSTFAEEREALRITILQKVDALAAQQRLQRFVSRFPRSTYRMGLENKVHD